ncbi:MAG: hypothetical protein D6770_01125 [Anaerolineae bacterium]|nr:MAG: hypothetical protein D6770_01125 [Anaerolineae bacterium]
MTDKWKEITVTWNGELSFTGENSAGGIVQMDSPTSTLATGPMELLLLALAGCTGMDIVSILKKKRQMPVHFKVKVRGRRAQTYPMVYKEIEVEYLLWGEGLKAKDVEQAIQLSEEKYCSVGITLKAFADLRSSYRILAPGEPEEGNQ